ncbi:tetratricopeptide repeat protein [Gloeocapsopsis dulcis]|uniref:MalT-like TPR region domain-containing protein n=1 Tax=Gloeocapsopsis dulcis AAB1 = 1H9 TaxID=1433147 RepID=A0A6N8FYQ9_9CHRO|nr:hypothetical protein [Gloeocapsopsis dulcis]MUL38280.1 hypothetical protein [Gloeocapsopsis dulcis AAB1 = 1H9]WNN89330.1 hypothetical protein P0S91_24370 [Gloeocapsopsis dulcis]
MGDFRVVTLLEIAEMYRLAGQSGRAAAVIDRAVAADRTTAQPQTDSIAAVYERLFVLSRFANQYAAIGKKEQAVELASKVFEVARLLPQQDYMTFNTLLNTSKLYTLAGQSDKAVAVFSYLLKTTENIKETFVKAFFLAQIGNEYAVLQQPNRATELLSQALELVKPEEVSRKSLVLITIARGYGVLQQYDKAIQVSHAVEPRSLRDEVKRTLMCSRDAR